MQEEVFCTCPHCWSNISILVTLEDSSQSYIEDCEVCCQPIQFSYQIEDMNIASFQARSTDE